MVSQRLNQIGLYAGYGGVALVLVAAGAALFERGVMSTPVFVALVSGLTLAVFSFFTSGIVTGRQMKYGTNSIVMTALLAVLLGFGYYLIDRYPYRIDLTKEKLFTLSDQTVTVLRELKEPVRAVVFFAPDTPELGSVQELLRGYKRNSDKFDFELVNFYGDPLRARALKAQDPGTVVFVLGDEPAKPEGEPSTEAEAAPESKLYAVSKTDYVEYDYSGMQMGQGVSTRFKGEQAFTTALMRLTGGQKTKVFFLDGHEEDDIESQEQWGLSRFKEALESEGYTTEKLQLFKSKQVPQDASLVLVAGPKRDLFPGEAELLTNYVKGGGKALILPNLVPAPALNEILSAFQIEAGSDVIFDDGSHDFFSPATTIAIRINPHEITDKVVAATLFLAARPLVIQADTQPWTVTGLVKTTDAAWAESNVRRIQFDPGVDRTGPFDLVVVAEGSAVDVPAELGLPPGPRTLDLGGDEAPSSDGETEAQPAAAGSGGGQGGGEVAEPTPAAPAAEPTPQAKTLRWSDQSRLAVFATSRVIGNGHFLQGGNRDLVMNTVGWLVGKKELISIRAKDTRQPPLVMSAGELANVFWIAVILVPALILLAGAMVWFQRR